MTAHKYKYDVVHVWALDMYLLYHLSLRAIIQVEYYCYYPCFIEEKWETERFSEIILEQIEKI